MGDALLAEIAARPEDDAPRRAFADGLLESGDALGKFIHAQLDLAAGGLMSAGRAERYRIEKELQPPAPAFPEGVECAEWHRGWIDRMRVTSSSFVAHATRIFEMAPLLRTVELSDLDRVTHSEPQAVAKKILDQLSAALSLPEARRLEGLIVPIGLMHQHEWDGVTKSWDGTPDSSTTIYELASLAVARIIAAELPRLHMLALPKLSAEVLETLARSPLGARIDHLHDEGLSPDDLRAYLDHSNVCALRGLACIELIEHAKLALLEELHVVNYEKAMRIELPRLRHLVTYREPGTMPPTIDVVHATTARAEGRLSWAFYRTARSVGRS